MKTLIATIKNTAVAFFYYLFIWKSNDISIFTKTEKFNYVRKGELKAEK